MEVAGEKRKVCLTGAGGFCASWLVKILLIKGYIVQGTVRDPTDKKNAHLKKLEKASENLQLFKADLLDYNSIAAAIAGCEGVFHVATPVPSEPEEGIIDTAVTGTLNVLKACSEAKIKRVVVVSSISALGFLGYAPNWSEDKILDEDCWADENMYRTFQEWYGLAKAVAERQAIEYGLKHGLDVVTICPSIVIGPLLQSTLNTSSLILYNILTGSDENRAWFMKSLDPVENILFNYLDVRDLADALLLLYEKPEASGRYICAPYSIKSRNLVDMLKSMYPNYNYPKNFVEPDIKGFKMSSEKLTMLGWKFRPFEESLIDSVEYYKEAGLLES